MMIPKWRTILHEAPVTIDMPDNVVPSAVLVVITADIEPCLILTRRSAALKKHAGQISFPGGRVDDDDSSLITTALRESQEEINLSADHVEICGYLPDMLTGTGYRITPVVAQSHLDTERLLSVLRPNPDEVDELLFVPVSLLLAPENYDSFMRRDGDSSWRSWRIGYQGHTIWGATAAILHHWAITL